MCSSNYPPATDLDPLAVGPQLAAGIPSVNGHPYPPTTPRTVASYCMLSYRDERVIGWYFTTKQCDDRANADELRRGAQ